MCGISPHLTTTPIFLRFPVLGAMCEASAMTGDSDFRIRPGRIRSTRAQQARPFIAQALAAAKKAGAGVSRTSVKRSETIAGGGNPDT